MTVSDDVLKVLKSRKEWRQSSGLVRLQSGTQDTRIFPLDSPWLEDDPTSEEDDEGVEADEDDDEAAGSDGSDEGNDDDDDEDEEMADEDKPEGKLIRSDLQMYCMYSITVRPALACLEEACIITIHSSHQESHLCCTFKEVGENSGEVFKINEADAIVESCRPYFVVMLFKLNDARGGVCNKL